MAPTSAIRQPLQANKFGQLFDIEGRSAGGFSANPAYGASGGYQVEGQPAAGSPWGALTGAPAGQPAGQPTDPYGALAAGVSGQANPFGGQQAALRRAGFQRAFGSQGANLNAALAARGQLNSGIARARLGGLYGAQAAQLQDFDTDEQLRQAEFERQRQQAMLQVLGGRQAQRVQSGQLAIQQAQEQRAKEQWEDQQNWGWAKEAGQFAGNIARILPW